MLLHEFNRYSSLHLYLSSSSSSGDSDVDDDDEDEGDKGRSNPDKTQLPPELTAEGQSR